MRDQLRQLITGSLDLKSHPEIDPKTIHDSMKMILEGKATPAQTAAWLTFLRLTGADHQADIVAECARAMLKCSVHLQLDSEFLKEFGNYWIADIVGTGGDGFDTFNASTAAGIVVAGCRDANILMAKHGNRSSSSACGSADLLEAAGCNLTVINDSEKVARSLRDSRFCFLFAQNFHTAMKHVAPLRKELGFPTVFNLLGPLTNPLRAQVMVVGVCRKELGMLFAQVLKKTGVKRALVVNGSEGLDEISTESPTFVWKLEETGNITEETIDPESFGLEPFSLTLVKGGVPSENAAILMRLLKNELKPSNPHLLFVLMNAAALLFATGCVSSLKEGLSMARKSVESGSALSAFQQYQKATLNAA